MPDYVPGLAGVPIGRSQICFIDGIAGVLEYRGIPIEELAEKSSFEETSYLLLYGKLPTEKELEDFNQQLTTHRRLKYKIVDALKCLPESGHPMEALQAAVAGLGMFYPGEITNAAENNLAAVRLIAKVPSIIAAFHRLRHGDEQILPRDDLSHAANFLYMMTGKAPDPLQARVLDIALILHAEHSMNASTFSARVVGSTLADPFTVISSAIGALRGPLHGGANEEALEMLREIGSPDRARSYILSKLEKKEKIPGLGHRVYKIKDPRSIILQGLAKELFKAYGGDPLYRVADAVEKVALEILAPKGVYPNVDFYSGIVYEMMGIPKDIYTPIFAMARVSGWLSHWLEQLQENHLFRPEQIYEGKRQQGYVPLVERG